MSTLRALAAEGVHRAAVDFALELGHPQVSRWVDATTLYVIAPDQQGDMLLIVSVETDTDEVLEIVYARYLDAAEARPDRKEPTDA